MYIKNQMTENPIVISKETSISQALDIMKKNTFHRLPVVDNGKLIGLVTEGVIASTTPTRATSLSIHELNYLLSKTTVEEVMIKDVHAIGPNALLEEAAIIMRKYNVGCLPVVDQEKLVGIITQNDIFDAFVSLLGYHTPGFRYVIEVDEDHPGVLSKIASIFFDAHANITNLAVYRKDKSVDVVIRANGVEEIQMKSLLMDSGFKVKEEKQN